MLTLKVITTDLDGQVRTHLFSGDSITHKEYFSSDHYIASKVQKNTPNARCIGQMLETSSQQLFVVSDVLILAGDFELKNTLFILPKADCYITDASGKTVDSFFCQYELPTNQQE
jgi:hypothetical protein